MKYTSGARENITYLDEGFIDLSTLKTVELGYVDMLTVPKQTLLAISNCYRSSSGNSYNAHVQLSLIFGSSLHQNKVAVYVTTTAANNISHLTPRISKSCCCSHRHKNRHMVPSAWHGNISVTKCGNKDLLVSKQPKKDSKKENKKMVKNGQNSKWSKMIKIV